ncbi:pilus assembly protein TadG-related protein [Vibrio vulnificus]
MDMTRHCKGKHKQQGLVLVLVTVAMLSFVIMAALAIDVTHQVVNRTKLQNAVDAAALAAAMVADATHNTTTATSAAKTTLTSMHSASGNSEMDIDSATFSIDYSNDPLTFPDSSFDDTGDIYVRVSVDDLSLSEFFMQALGMSKEVSASAVAGPSSDINTISNVVPIGVCKGDETGGIYGYNAGEVYVLKVGDSSLSSMGAGNYHLLDFGSGADTVREALGGGYDGTVQIGGSINTQTGVAAGPVGQGANTRLGIYQGGVSSSDYPPDYITDLPDTPATLDSDGNVVYDYAGDLTYAEYKAKTEACIADSSSGDCESGGQPWRRVLPIPMVDCSGSSGGTTTYTVVEVGCFFLLQRVPTNNSGIGQVVFGEFVDSCVVENGSIGNTPGNQGAYKIVIYEDPNNGDS